MMLAALSPQGSSPSTMLTVAKRPLNATSGTFQPINSQTQLVSELLEDRIVVPGMTQLDGTYIILVAIPKAAAIAPATSQVSSESEMTLASTTKRDTIQEEKEALYLVNYLKRRGLDPAEVAVAMDKYINKNSKSVMTSNASVA
jgi:hypothetical protein